MTVHELLQALDELELRNPDVDGVELVMSPDGSGCIRAVRRSDVPSPFSAMVSALYPQNYEIECEFENLDELDSILRNHAVQWSFVKEPTPVRVEINNDGCSIFEVKR